MNTDACSRKGVNNQEDGKENLLLKTLSNSTVEDRVEKCVRVQ